MTPVLRTRYGLTLAAVVVAGVGLASSCFVLAVRGIDKAVRTIGQARVS